MGVASGAREEIRTPAPQIRSPGLYVRFRVIRDRVESAVGPLMSAMPPKAEALAAAVIGVYELMLPPWT
jgi:hypothetical protein